MWDACENGKHGAWMMSVALAQYSFFCIYFYLYTSDQYMHKICLSESSLAVINPWFIWSTYGSFVMRTTQQTWDGITFSSVSFYILFDICNYTFRQIEVGKYYVGKRTIEMKIRKCEENVNAQHHTNDNQITSFTFVYPIVYTHVAIDA